MFWITLWFICLRFNGDCSCEWIVNDVKINRRYYGKHTQKTDRQTDRQTDTRLNCSTYIQEMPYITPLLVYVCLLLLSCLRQSGINIDLVLTLSKRGGGKKKTSNDAFLWQNRFMKLTRGHPPTCITLLTGLLNILCDSWPENCRHGPLWHPRSSLVCCM